MVFFGGWCANFRNLRKTQNTHHPQFWTRDVGRRFCGGGAWISRSEEGPERWVREPCSRLLPRKFAHFPESWFAGLLLITFELGVPKPGCPKPGCLQFLRFFAPVCAVLWSCVCALLFSLRSCRSSSVNFFNFTGEIGGDLEGCFRDPQLGESSRGNTIRGYRTESL